MEDIKDIHLPVEFPMWGWILLGVMVLGLIAGVLLWLRHKRKLPLTDAVHNATMLPSEIALDALDVLVQKNYPEQGLFKEYYVDLSDIVRHYLENRFSMKAPEMTTEEFLLYANNSDALSDTQKIFLKDFLNGCDMVKFAKHRPTVAQAQANVDVARKLIVDTSYGI